MPKFNTREEYDLWKAERHSQREESPSATQGQSASRHSSVDSNPEIEKMIRRAWQIGTGMGILSLIMVIVAIAGYPILGLTTWNLVDTAFIFLLSFGVYKKNRTAALVLFLYYVLTKILTAVMTGNYAGSGGVAVVFGYFFLNGVRGTFAYHKARSTDGNGIAWKPVVAATSIIVLFSIVSFSDQIGLTDRLFRDQRGVQRAEWREITFADASCSVQMPEEPVKSTNTLSSKSGEGSIQMTSYTVQMQGKKEFVFFYYDLPESQHGYADVSAIFRSMIDAEAQEFKVKIVNEKPVSLGKWPGKEIHAENEQVAYRSLMFLVNGRIYRLIAFVAKADIFSSDVEQFMSSFRLTHADGQVLTPADPIAVTWVAFSPVDARFTVDLPGAPVADQENVSTSAGNMVVYRFNLNRDDLKEHFSIQYADYPEKLLRKMKPYDEVLKSAGSADIENFKGTLVSSKTLTTEAYPGMELHAENEESGMRLRIYLVDGRLYKVKAICPKNLLFTSEDNKFMDSFRLVPEKASSSRSET